MKTTHSARPHYPAYRSRFTARYPVWEMVGAAVAIGLLTGIMLALIDGRLG